MYWRGRRGKTKGHRLHARVTAKDKIPPPRGWAGHARVGRESGFGGKHIRDRTETPHRFLDEKVRVNARTYFEKGQEWGLEVLSRYGRVPARA